MKKFAIFFALIISTFSYANMLDTSITKCDQVGDTIEGKLKKQALILHLKMYLLSERL